MNIMDVPIYLILLVPAAAAFASWWLADRQGRSAKPWVLWTLLLGGPVGLSKDLLRMRRITASA